MVKSHFVTTCGTVPAILVVLVPPPPVAIMHPFEKPIIYYSCQDALRPSRASINHRAEPIGLRCEGAPVWEYLEPGWHSCAAWLACLQATKAMCEITGRTLPALALEPDSLVRVSPSSTAIRALGFIPKYDHQLRTIPYMPL